MKRKLTILLILLMSMVTSHAINTVKVKNVLVSQGGKANIVVELANSESVTAFTMKLVLPQGVDYVSFSKNDSRFSDHELCISKDFWHLVCKSNDGYDIVIDEYKKNAHYINEALDEIKDAYLPNS